MKGFRLRSSGRGSGFKVLIHKPAQDYLTMLERLDRDDAMLCADAIAALGADPFKSRPGCEVERWKGPEFDYWLCRGRHHVGYRVERDVVRVVDIWFK
jgi:hypothetical protein